MSDRIRFKGFRGPVERPNEYPIKLMISSHAIAAQVLSEESAKYGVWVRRDYADGEVKEAMLDRRRRDLLSRPKGISDWEFALAEFACNLVGLTSGDLWSLLEEGLIRFEESRNPATAVKEMLPEVGELPPDVWDSPCYAVYFAVLPSERGKGW